MIRDIKKLVKLKECKECGESDLVWQASSEIKNGIVQGKLNTSDVNNIFFLGCEYCSETLGVVDEDDVADLLTGINKGE